MTSTAFYIFSVHLDFCEGCCVLNTHLKWWWRLLLLSAIFLNCIKYYISHYHMYGPTYLYRKFLQHNNKLHLIPLCIFKISLNKEWCFNSIAELNILSAFPFRIRTIKKIQRTQPCKNIFLLFHWNFFFLFNENWTKVI